MKIKGVSLRFKRGFKTLDSDCAHLEKLLDLTMAYSAYSSVFYGFEITKAK